MAFNPLSLGTVADDGTGDRLRPGGLKINQNFDQLFSAAADAAGRLGAVEAFTQDGTGAVARPLGRKLADWVDVRDFGADPTGARDATDAWRAAFATGQNVMARGTHRLSGTVSFAASRQWLDARGARIIMSGASDVLACGSDVGMEGCGIVGGYIDAGNMTDGRVLSLRNAPRFSMTDVVCWSPWRFGVVVACNWVAFHNIWINNVRGDYGLGWYGDDATGKSDVLRLAGFCISGGATNRPAALVMDGSVHTLQIQGYAAVKVAHGLWVRNSTNAAIGPSFVFADDFEVDFPSGHAVRLDAGSHFYFTNSFYAHGSTGGSGVYVGPDVAPDTVGMGGGKVTGHARYGVENAVRVRAVNLYGGGNGLGDYLNPDRIVARTPRLEIDPTAYFAVNGGSPLVAFDANDYLIFNRNDNRLGLTIGAATLWSVDATRMFCAVPVRLPPFAFGSLPDPVANAGNTVRVSDRSHRLATSDGVQWRWADGVVAT